MLSLIGVHRRSSYTDLNKTGSWTRSVWELETFVWVSCLTRLCPCLLDTRISTDAPPSPKEDSTETSQ